jgi:hypothetical protein
MGDDADVNVVVDVGVDVGVDALRRALRSTQAMKCEVRLSERNVVDV